MTQLTSVGLIRKFILGGHATFSVQLDNGSHKTYSVKSAKIDKDKNWSTNNIDKTMFFVSVLTGSDNESSYQYMGILKLYPIDGIYHLAQTKGSKVGTESKSWQIFKQLWTGIEQQCRVPTTLKFFHEGQCCVCGRKLTVPESIERGIGPECMEKGG